MIVSHRHKFIFVAIPKTGTHSIREALRPHLATDDWEQCRLFVKKAFPIPQIAAIKHGHISCGQIKQHLHPAMWNNYLKFCVVRNPFDRFVSYCYFINRENHQMTNDPLGTMKQTITGDGIHHLLARRQFEFVSDNNGDLMVDCFCHVENLQQDFDKVTSQLSLPQTVLGQKNTSKHEAYQDCYDDELRALVAEFYDVDLKMFNYDFEQAVPAHAA